MISEPDIEQPTEFVERATREHVLILVQNLPVPLDRRVWLECQTLVRAGYRVSVICPKGPGDPAREMLDGVRLLKYDPPPVAAGGAGFALECGVSWMQTARLARRLWREDPFDVIQACNPPDTFFLIGRMFRSKGVKFVFDHHDLCPEIYPLAVPARPRPRHLVPAGARAGHVRDG